MGAVPAPDALLIPSVVVGAMPVVPVVVAGLLGLVVFTSAGAVPADVAVGVIVVLVGVGAVAVGVAVVVVPGSEGRTVIGRFGSGRTVIGRFGAAGGAGVDACATV